MSSHTFWGQRELRTRQQDQKTSTTGYGWREKTLKYIIQLAIYTAKGSYAMARSELARTTGKDGRCLWRNFL